MNVTLGIIGLGEVGGIFGRGLLGKEGVEAVYAWDTKFAGADGAAARETAKAAGIEAVDSMAALCAKATLLISAVTASNTLAVAEEAARHVRAGTLFLDLNSASPGTKKTAAAALEAAGARYVEAGVMTSVPPYGIRVPMLLGGKQAQSLAATLNGWGMDAKPVSEELGIASAIKMSRSVMIKGLEALVIESYATARFYGVEDHVLPTLQETFPQIDWTKQGAYFFSRVVQHGKRRAEEMRESARTVQEAGFDPFMTSATAEKQDWVARLAREGVFEGLDLKTAPWQDYADRLLKAAGK
ncbi:NAD binding domain of 6-phosphogluconate dehydrogenase [Pigmentiphaga humi]|uniref:NAD binding domain of 6-phosphogluconate dehydrogenase n=1 Tax=Pigmentiphaga humi TaxID=2478468 RepID=A0A3P4B1S6_9BURK|nr:NAD(P)-dependent oxidoreductase [Pigmentiphaga humi]VCU69608.1 NAD binding domain of 6-phosphogluconate dehydrogenase [Pigmentiphaga humi]